MKNKKWLKKLRSIAKYFIITLGFFFLLLIVIAFTRIPYDVHRWLGMHNSDYHFSPDYLVFLGGSGMPSESNLIRIYYTAKLAQEYSSAKIMIVHPTDTNVISLIREEMIAHGIDSTAILVEKYGTNTREQALMIAKMKENIKEKSMVLVTSPENMYRTVRVFRRAGFLKIGGEPAFENAMFVDLAYSHRQIGGKRFVPDVSANTNLRYTFWNYLKLEITCLRELTAIIYYKLNGWI